MKKIFLIIAVLISVTGFTQVIPFQCDPPACSTVDDPTDNETGVAVDVTLSWNASALADGYIIVFDGGSPETLANVLTYQPDPELDFGTEYTWTVTPINSFGAATSCTQWSFTTLYRPNTKYISFGGTDEFLNWASPLSDLGTVHTVCFWDKSTNAPGTTGSMIGRADGAYNFTGFYSSNFNYADNNEAKNVAYTNNNTWHFFCVTRNGTALTFYKDCESLGTNTLANSGTFEPQNIGKFYTSLMSVCSMDDLMIYDDVLSVSQMEDLYGDGTPGNGNDYNPYAITNPALIHYVDFETTITTIKDLITDETLTNNNMESGDIVAY
jgi:hypothetical protein